MNLSEGKKITTSLWRFFAQIGFEPFLDEVKWSQKIEGCFSNYKNSYTRRARQTKNLVTPIMAHILRSFKISKNFWIFNLIYSKIPNLYSTQTAKAYVKGPYHPRIFEKSIFFLHFLIVLLIKNQCTKGFFKILLIFWNMSLESVKNNM